MPVVGERDGVEQALEGALEEGVLVEGVEVDVGEVWDECRREGEVEVPGQRARVVLQRGGEVGRGVGGDVDPQLVLEARGQERGHAGEAVVERGEEELSLIHI